MDILSSLGYVYKSGLAGRDPASVPSRKEMRELRLRVVEGLADHMACE